MKKKHSGKGVPAQGDALRYWVLRAIWCLGGITLAGIILGGVLLLRISRTSGWSTKGEHGGRQVEIYTKEQTDKFITSVLITIQNQPMSQPNVQADMIFVASFNALEQRLTMVSFASGTLVEVEGHGQKTLGEAYALGGPGLLVNTINQNFELDLQNYACTDTHSLAAMIDLLGGVPIELTAEEAGYIQDALGAGGEGLPAGPAILSGAQTMVHAMDNRSGQEPLGSLQRSLDLVCSAVFNMRKTATKEAMLPLLSLVFSSIQTNLDLTTLRDLGYEILKAEDMEYHGLTLPCEGSWSATGEAGEQIRADIPRNGALLRETLYNAQ